MRIDWAPLRVELAHWRAEDISLPFWWRDDDATAPSAALDQLCSMANGHEIPLHLAVIPKNATKALADQLSGHDAVVALVHGWAHENHQTSGKKAEFGDARPIEDQIDDVQAGLTRLNDLFSETVAPVFVPPWNRMTPAMIPALSEIGIKAVSTFGNRTQGQIGPIQINTHIDPIAWRTTRGLLPPGDIIAQLCTLLQDRREDRVDRTEPLGYLTHHLVHDVEIWDFTHQLMAEMRAGGVEPFRFYTSAEKRT